MAYSLTSTLLRSRHSLAGTSSLRARRSFSSIESGLASRFWTWTTTKRPHWRESGKEAAILFTVFGITGSSSVMLVRPSLKSLGLEGNMRDGPWSYRVISLLAVSPIYSVVLMTLGTLAGRHLFFANMGSKILRRFLPRAAADKLLMCPPAAAAASAPASTTTGSFTTAMSAAARKVVKDGAKKTN